MADDYDCADEVELAMEETWEVRKQVERLEAEVAALRQAVAITLTEINSHHGGWGRGTATSMVRQILRDLPFIQEIPPNSRNVLRDRILPPLAKP